MMSATEDKADIKKRLIPFLIGLVIFFGFERVFTVIVDISKEVGVDSSYPTPINRL